jgi:hypothetical protein
MELVILNECENGERNPYRESYNQAEQSYGFCQISRIWHKDIVDNSLFWNDWRWQIEQCNTLMKNGTAFYGRERVISGVKCSEYVKERFYFN